MSYRSILVNIDIDGPAAPLVGLATELAARFKARLIGFSAAAAALPITGPEGSAIAVEVWQQQRDDIEGRLGELHAEFEKLVAGAVPIDWRQMVADPTRSLADAARLADLVVTGAPAGASTGDTYRAVDPGSLVLQAGRPVLVAAHGAEHIAAKKVVVAWKDSREARRAVADALPLLHGAADVTVVAANRNPDDDLRESIADVAAFLASHGTAARTEILAARDESAALTDFLAASHADLVVSGAYGHSRLREWAFGGVTRSLLDEVGLSRFMAS